MPLMSAGKEAALSRGNEINLTQNKENRELSLKLRQNRENSKIFKYIYMYVQLPSILPLHWFEPSHTRLALAMDRGYRSEGAVFLTSVVKFQVALCHKLPLTRSPLIPQEAAWHSCLHSMQVGVVHCSADFPPALCWPSSKAESHHVSRGHVCLHIPVVPSCQLSDPSSLPLLVINRFSVWGGGGSRSLHPGPFPAVPPTTVINKVIWCTEDL